MRVSVYVAKSWYVCEGECLRSRFYACLSQSVSLWRGECVSVIVCACFQEQVKAGPVSARLAESERDCALPIEIAF